VTVDVVLFAVWQFLLWLPVAVVAIPPVVMGVRHRWSAAGVALWLVVVALAVGWGAAWNAGMDRADATGESGSPSSDLGWLVGAVAAATASIVLAARPRTLRE
jgi:hypothetical protein